MPATPLRTPRTSSSGPELVRRSAFTSYIDTLRSSGLQVVHDDVRTNGFNFEGMGQAWSVNRDSRWLGGTDTLWEGTGVGTLGSFEMVVSGKELSVVGRAPSSPGATFVYLIDGGEKVELPFASSPPSSPSSTSTGTSNEDFPYREWATVPLPSDTKSHRLSILHLPIGTSIDYAVLSVPDSAPLAKEDLVVVDDGDGILEWKGAWTELKGDDLRLDGGIAAFGGGVHAASEVGSEVKIRFIGSSISLYTLLPPSSLSASFTLDDGAPQTRSYGSLSLSPNEDQPVVPNYLLFSSSGLLSALHTLTVKLVENEPNSSFTLDYITYTPSFSSLDTLAASGGDPAKYGSAASPEQDGDGGRKAGMSPGTMAGTIMGVVVVVLTLITCFCCQGKRYFFKRAWRNWRKGSRGSAGEGSKRELNNTSSSDEKRSRSPDWAFRNPDASRDDSRTSLEIDLDLDLSPRAREKRHQKRDKARTKIRVPESVKEGDGERSRRGERSRSRTRVKGDGGVGGPSSGGGKNESKRPGAGASVDLEPWERWSVSLDLGPFGSGLGHQEPAVAPVTEHGLHPTFATLLSEKARGKLPARDDCASDSVIALAGEAQPTLALTPFTYSQSRSPTPPPPANHPTTEDTAENEDMCQVEQANIVTPCVYQPALLTPFTSMEPSSHGISLSKDRKEKDSTREKSGYDDNFLPVVQENGVTPFTAMEPSSSSGPSKMKEIHRVQVLDEGAVTPFTITQPPTGVGSSSKGKEPSYTQPSPLATTPPSHIPPTPHHPSNIQSSHIALQAQLSALMEEVNRHQSRGEDPDTERLGEVVRLGRMIEEGVVELEGRRHAGAEGEGEEGLPPAYSYEGLDEGDERIGIAL